MKQYLQAFKYGVGYATAYRMRLLVWFLQGIVWIVALPFIWLTIYGSEENIAGFSKTLMITYFFCIPFVQSLTYHHVDYEIQEDIKNGHIINFILKPIGYLPYQFFVEIGYKMVDVIAPILTMILLYPVLRSFLALPHFSLELLWFIPVVVLGSILGFLISSIVGMVAFWTTRAEWASHLWWMVSTFVGGFVAPLEFFPETAKTIISYTPFPLLIDTPVSVLLGTISRGEIIHQVLFGGMWIIGLLLVTSFMYRRGIKRIEGIGI